MIGFRRIPPKTTRLRVVRQAHVRADSPSFDSPHSPSQEVHPNACLSVKKQRTPSFYWICRPCHDHIHGVLSEKEMAAGYHSREALLAHPAIRRFAAWIETAGGFYAGGAKSEALTGWSGAFKPWKRPGFVPASQRYLGFPASTLRGPCRNPAIPLGKPSSPATRRFAGRNVVE